MTAAICLTTLKLEQPGVMDDLSPGATSVIFRAFVGVTGGDPFRGRID